MSNSIRRQIISERISRLIEWGTSYGIYSQKLIPSPFKNQSLRLYRTISGSGKSKGQQTWIETLFDFLWAGNPRGFIVELHSSIAGIAASRETVDAVVRMTHYASTNYGIKIDDELDLAFTNWANRISVAQGSLAQWVFTRRMNGDTSAVDLDSQGQSILTAMISTENIGIRSNSQIVAAIRNSFPEEWIRGHELHPRPELQDELELWLSWLLLSKDLEVLRHARRFMLKANMRNSYIVIDEGSPNDSNVALMIHGIPIPERAASENRGRKFRGLYFLNNSLPWDSQGYATRSHGLLTGINRKGWKIDALTRLGYPFDRHSKVSNSKGTASIEISDVKYRRLGRGKTNNMGAVGGFISEYACRALSVADEVNPEIIHAASNSWNGIAALLVARKRGIPFVYEVRGLWEITGRSANPGYEFTLRYRLAVRLETIAAQEADHVFTLTDALRNELVRRGVNPSTISILSNCVDADRFTPRSRDTILEAKLGVENKVVIGYVGSLLDYEGIDQLICAAQALSTRRSDFHIIIVGSGSAENSLRELVRELDVQDLITFTGRVPHNDVERYYSLIDIAPFPRLPIPVCEMVSPLKPFEAMAMKKVCIVSSVAAMVEMIRHGDTGFVYDKNSLQSLIDTLNLVIDDSELRKKIGENARTWIKAERTWEHAADRVEAVYAALTQ
jgi:PEP-CTERM/exosortase A-associated glycosyltransferase